MMLRAGREGLSRVVIAIVIAGQHSLGVAGGELVPSQRTSAKGVWRILDFPQDAFCYVTPRACLTLMTLMQNYGRSGCTWDPNCHCHHNKMIILRVSWY